MTVQILWKTSPLFASWSWLVSSSGFPPVGLILLLQGGVFCGVSWLPKDPSTGSLPLLSLVSPVCCAHSLFLQYPLSPDFKKTSTVVPVPLLTQYKTTQHKQYEKGNKLFKILFSSQIRSPSLKERTLIQIQEKQDCYGTDPSIH